MFMKIIHGLAPALGAALAAAVPALGIPIAVKAAVGAFLAYLLKPARPENNNP